MTKSKNENHATEQASGAVAVRLPYWAVKGATFFSYDEEDKAWYKTEIDRIEDGVVHCVDIDDNSSWPGLHFELNVDDLYDETQVRLKVA